MSILGQKNIYVLIGDNMKLIFKKLFVFINNKYKIKKSKKTEQNTNLNHDNEIYNNLIKKIENSEGREPIGLPLTYKEFNNNLNKLDKQWEDNQ